MGRGRRMGHHSYGRAGMGIGGSFIPPTVIPTPFLSTTSNTIQYQGPYTAFMIQFARLTPEQKQSVRVINIQLHGQIVQQSKTCCLLATIITGSICIIPLFLLCCDCFKKSTNELRKLTLEAYFEVAKAVSECPNVHSLMIGVADNYLTPSSTAAIESSILNNRNIKFFIFRNSSPGFDMEANEFTNFQSAFPNIKQTNQLMYSIIWSNKVASNMLPANLANPEMVGNIAEMSMQQIKLGVNPTVHPQ